MQPENVQNVQNVLDVLDVLDVLNVLNVSAVTFTCKNVHVTILLYILYTLNVLYF